MSDEHLSVPSYARVFGAACYHFGYKTAQQHIDGGSYLEELVAAFRQMTNIVEFAVDADDDLRNLDEDVEFDWGELDDGHPPTPSWFFSTVNILLHIPRRVQAEVLGRGEHSLDLGTETFRLHFSHQFRGP